MANAINGTPSGYTASGSVNGLIGKAISFNGTSQFISLPGISLNLTAGIAVSAWINISSYNQGADTARDGLPVEKIRAAVFR